MTTTTSRKATVALPWGADQSERFVREAWPGFARWMNASVAKQGNDLRREFRLRLDQILKGEFPSEMRVPAGYLVLREGVLRLDMGRVRGILFDIREFDVAEDGAFEGLYSVKIQNTSDERRDFYLRLLAVLAAEPKLRRRVKACAHCGRYFMLKTARPDRGKDYRASFCSSGCSCARKTEQDRARQKDDYRRRRDHADSMSRLVSRVQQDRARKKDGPSMRGLVSHKR
ncbi:MAG: hypothetical protein K1Y01_21235 [Vicinamibacteria bacterium]|nr:hypothetical protein [Vicinamibacteria bacterium]